MKIDFENLLPINRKFRVVEFYYSKDYSKVQELKIINACMIHCIYNYICSIVIRFLEILNSFYIDEYICIKQYIFLIYEIIP